MKPSPSTAARAAWIAVASVAIAAVSLGPTRASAQSTEFDTGISIAELMEALVMPEADVIWGAVQFVSSADDEGMVGPETDEEWLAVRHNAIALAEVANNLMIPGRPANRPDAEALPGELSPGEIEDLIDSQRSAWNGYARALRTVAMQAVEVIDARDSEALFLETGGDLDAACEACHTAFWYPSQ